MGEVMKRQDMGGDALSRYSEALHLSGSDIGLLTAVYFVEQSERFKSLGMDESAEIMKEVLLALSVGKLRWK